MAETRPPAHKVPPWWIFAITGIPYGIGGAFMAAITPTLATNAKLDLDAIGWFTLVQFIPPMIQFLYAPVVDVWIARKHWLWLLTCASAVLYFCALQFDIATDQNLFLAFAVAGQFAVGLTGSCNGGIMAQLIPDDLRGKASAALNVGNLCAGGVGGGVFLLLAKGTPDDPAIIQSRPLLGLIVAAMLVPPAFASLVIEEPPPPVRKLFELLRSLLRDVRKILFSKSGVTGYLLCLSPVGTAALGNVFAGLGDAYHANKVEQFILIGPGNAALNAIGAFAGGWMCDVYNRRAVYLLSGLLTAICGLAMAVAPTAEYTFVFGVTAYMFITGICYAAFTATVLETIGESKQNAATKYALFVSAGNAAINYVQFLDTKASARAAQTVQAAVYNALDPYIQAHKLSFTASAGTPYVVGADATQNIIGVVVLAAVFIYFGYFKTLRRVPVPQA